MSPRPAVPATAPLIEATQIMRERRVAALAVTGAAGGGPAIITERDIVNAVASGAPIGDQKVSDHLTSVVVTGEPDWDLARALDTMLHGGFRHLVIIDQGEAVGMVSMRDIMRRFIETLGSEQAGPPETIEFGAVNAAAARMLQLFRRSAKQHMVAAKCYCELDWLEILVGQIETRPELTGDELQALWDLRELCPVLTAEGGGAD